MNNQELPLSLKILIGVCVIYGLCILLRDNKESYSNIKLNKRIVYEYALVPKPYHYQKVEDEYQDFMRHRLKENIEYDIY